MIIRSSHRHRLRHHRRLLLCGRLPLHRLLRRALVEGAHWPSHQLRWNLGMTLMSVELLLKARLRIGSPLEGIHRDFEFSAANAADSECRSGVKPFDDRNAALDHVSFSPNLRQR